MCSAPCTGRRRNWTCRPWPTPATKAQATACTPRSSNPPTARPWPSITGPTTCSYDRRAAAENAASRSSPNAGKPCNTPPPAPAKSAASSKRGSSSPISSTATYRFLAEITSLSAHLGQLRFVHLRRRDVVAQAVSWAKSLQTHFWHPGEAVALGGQDPHYDEELIGRLVATIERSETDWTVWFASHSIVPCAVTYEELAADPPRSAQKVLDYLGLNVPPDR